MGSNPIRVVDPYGSYYGILAQLGEHLPYKQRVIGSSPIGPIHMARWLNWLERPVHTREVESSSLSLATKSFEMIIAGSFDFIKERRLG